MHHLECERHYFKENKTWKTIASTRRLLAKIGVVLTSNRQRGCINFVEYTRLLLNSNDTNIALNKQVTEITAILDILQPSQITNLYTRKNLKYHAT